MASNLEASKKSDICDRRIWIGNLDQRVNEYQLLKTVRVYGNIEKFDMMLHRSGPCAGQPRGFAFITYKHRKDALSAIASLDGQMLGNRRLAVKFAKQTTDDSNSRPELAIAALSCPKPEVKISKKVAIQSIEAKLKMLEEMKTREEFDVNKSHANETPIIAQYQTNKHQLAQSKSSFRRIHPYHKKR